MRGKVLEMSRYRYSVPEHMKMMPRMESLEEEAICLAGAMNDQDFASKVALMGATDFHHRQHRAMLATIKRLVSNGDPVGAITIMRCGQMNNTLEEMGGAAYIANVAESFVGISFCEYAMRFVKKCAKRRMLALTCERLHYTAHEWDKDPDELIEKAINHLQAVLEAK
jgi:replicative DNA helicase